MPLFAAKLSGAVALCLYPGGADTLSVDLIKVFNTATAAAGNYVDAIARQSSAACMIPDFETVSYMSYGDVVCGMLSVAGLVALSGVIAGTYNILTGPRSVQRVPRAERDLCPSGAPSPIN